MHSRFVARAAALALLASAAGCLSSSGPSGPTGVGTVRLLVETTGVDLDPDGYLARIANARSAPVGINDVVEFVDLAPGSYTLLLEGVAFNCVVDGGNERTVFVPSGNAVEVKMEVTCSPAGLTSLDPPVGRNHAQTYLQPTQETST